MLNHLRILSNPVPTVTHLYHSTFPLDPDLYRLVAPFNVSSTVQRSVQLELDYNSLLKVDRQ